jgi:hypothetical protein
LTSEVTVSRSFIPRSSERALAESDTVAGADLKMFGSSASGCFEAHTDSVADHNSERSLADTHTVCEALLFGVSPEHVSLAATGVVIVVSDHVGRGTLVLVHTFTRDAHQRSRFWAN